MQLSALLRYTSHTLVCSRKVQQPCTCLLSSGTPAIFWQQALPTGTRIAFKCHFGVSSLLFTGNGCDLAMEQHQLLAQDSAQELCVPLLYIETHV